MAVQGIEIKVGQKWRTRGGLIAEVIGEDEHPDFPLDVRSGCDIWCVGRNGYEFGDIGSSHNPPSNYPEPGDLIELLEDAPGDLIELIEDAPSAELTVEYAGTEPTDSDKLASETLTALGYHFDGQCWVANGEPSALEQHPLYTPFVDAINQAMYGKGQRHGGATVPFLDQPIFHYAKMHGRGFLTGQAAKKLEEAASTRSGDAFVTEVLGALVYAGAAIISERGAK